MLGTLVDFSQEIRGVSGSLYIPAYLKSKRPPLWEPQFMLTRTSRASYCSAPSLPGLYVENSTVIHQASETGLRNITDNYRKTRLGERPTGLIRVKGQRIIVTHTQYARSPQFRAEVLETYSYRCAMCDIQLDLIEAAHVVPHAHPQGVDVIGNGVALCHLAS